MNAGELAQELRFTIDLRESLVQQTMRGKLVKNDRAANRVVIAIMDGKEEMDLSGVAVMGAFIRPGDSAEIPLSGSTNGNEASVTLEDACYDRAGTIEIFIRLSLGGITRTILKLTGDVIPKGSGAYVDITGTIPSVDDIIAQYAEMKAVTQRTLEAAQRAEELKIDASGYAGNTAKLGGKPPEYYIQPMNLLDNSDFANPVNQRGKTSYTGNGPNIDRWKTTNSNMTVEVADEGLRLSVRSTAAGQGYLRQQLAGDFSSGVYTLAVCVKGGKGALYFTTDSVASGVSSVNITQSSDWTIFCVSGDVGAGTRVPNQFTIRCDLGESIEVKWAALYEGAYTADTLPPYVPKGYAAEWIECRRYYRRIEQAYVPAATHNVSGSKRFAISFQLETPMAKTGKNPTAEIVTPPSYIHYGGKTYALSELAVVESEVMDGSVFILIQTSTDIESGYAAYVSSGVYAINNEL